MRVTHRMISGSANVNLQQSLGRLDQRSRQLSTGKAFYRPSQDPIGTNRVMRYRDAISRNERFQLNINEAKGWLQATESALMEALSVMQRISDLSIYGANGALSDTELLSIAGEVHEFYEHLVGVGNTEHSGLYIFGGHRTGEPPYREGTAGLEYHGDTGEMCIRDSLLAALQEAERLEGRNDPPDAARLKELQEEIDQGIYEIDARKVAEAMLRSPEDRPARRGKGR